MNERTRECDVLVIGAGPAGIAAAACAAEEGMRVVVIDEGAGPGGQIWRPSSRNAAPRAARRWMDRLRESGAVVVQTAAVVDLSVPSPQCILALAEAHGAGFSVEGRTVVLATGARERFLPFPGWTLPNVFGVGAAQALLKSGLSFRGRRVVVAGTGPLVLPVAASLARAGAVLALVAEQAPGPSVARFAASLWRRPALLLQAAAYRRAFIRTRYTTGTWVTAAHGDSAVHAVTVTDGVTQRVIECDFICAAFGLVPNTELARLGGCATRGEHVVVDARQTTTVPNIYCAGEPTGIGGVELAIAEGQIAGRAAAGRPVAADLIARAAALRAHADALEEAFALRPDVYSLAARDTIVCRCEDVRLSDLDSHWSARQARLYARVGMGPCQGRICGPALQSIMRWDAGADTIRAPTQPARVSTLCTRSQTMKPSEGGAR